MAVCEDHRHAGRHIAGAAAVRGHAVHVHVAHAHFGDGSSGVRVKKEKWRPSNRRVPVYVRSRVRQTVLGRSGCVSFAQESRLVDVYCFATTGDGRRREQKLYNEMEIEKRTWPELLTVSRSAHLAAWSYGQRV